MIIYLAGEAYGRKIFKEVDYKFNRLESFYSVFKKSHINVDPKSYNRFLLDSGAFTFIMAKKNNAEVKVDIDYFTDAYIEYINHHDIELFFEMDVDSIFGYDKVLQLRKRIEAQTGKRCIPVFHKSRGLDDWNAMVKDYDYASIGMAGKDVGWGDHKTFLKFVNSAYAADCKMHGLGITGMRSLDAVPFYSVDSSSWTAGNRYKGIVQFDGSRIKNLRGLDGKRISNHEGLALHNLTEWMKFSDFMESKTINY